MLSRFDNLSLQASFAKARGSEIQVRLVRGDTQLGLQKCVVLSTAGSRAIQTDGVNVISYDAVLFAHPDFNVMEGDSFIYVNTRYRVERVSPDRSIQTRCELVCLQ